MIKSVELITLPYYQENNGDLVVAEGNSSEFSFSIARIFNIRAQRGDVRGKHAHLQCTQMLICTNGAIEVYCDDNSTTEVYVLDKPNYALLISPGIWTKQKYLVDNTVLTVLCDRPYEEEDYIRNYTDFIVYCEKEQLCN